MRFHPACGALLLATFAALAGLAVLPARAEEEPPPPIWPTTTVLTGDRGGLYFGQKPDPRKTRRYFVAAEPVAWDFAPSGSDDVCGLTLPPALAANQTRAKLRYLQYTDATFRTPALPNPALGILGPILRGVVGEFLSITFLNRTARPVSMHPHGVRYDKDSEGAYYRPDPGRGAAVAPGATFTYVWHLDEQSGPLPTEPSSKAWLYHSHVLGDTETNLGLIGALIVTDPKRARPDGTPADIDREFATLFMIFDESDLDPGLTLTPAANPPPPLPARLPPLTPAEWSRRGQRLEETARYTVNGYAFGNLRGLEMNEGERTRWYLFALGSEQDFHTAHWHGLRVVEDGRRRTDVVELLPATMKTAELLADNPGSWLYHCHVAEHMREGMFARLTVYARDSIGASRTPADAFLGLPAAVRSLALDRAETTLNVTVAPARADIVITGTVTAPDSFAPAGQTVRIQFGAKTIEFHPNAQGVAREPRAMLRLINTEDTGTIPGGVVEFELVLNGVDWLQGVPPAAPGAPRPVELVIELAGARHTATARLAPRLTER